jgi:hypothetical protein
MEMSKLISGKEALIAWGNGKDVQISHKGATLEKEWHDLYGTLMLSAFDSDMYEFRLKPRAITINGIEVPAPFKPKEGETYWFITDSECGYNCVENKQGCRVGIAAWHTEDEIKQVVAALRIIFNKG